VQWNSPWEAPPTANLPRHVFLPVEFQAQLDLPRNAPRGGDTREVGSVREIQSPEAVRKIRVIQEIEEFAAELELPFLGNPELLE
jgi:hypothetical protein